MKTVSFVSGKRRILFPVVTLVAAKLATASWILELPLAGNPFLEWDSGWYLTLAQYGYPAWDTHAHMQTYAFMPGYPALIRLGYFIFHDWVLAAAIPPFILGIASIVIFQRIAEFYLTKRQAVVTTIIFAFFPYVFLFTSTFLCFWTAGRVGTVFSSVLSLLQLWTAGPKNR